MTSIIGLWVALRKTLMQTRRLLKRMGEGAGVDIEPDEQTVLCEETMKIPGVVCAGVPGAGGVDAVYALTLGSAARKQVEKHWSSWTKRTVCPLQLTGEKGQNAGIRNEVLPW